MKGIRAIVFVKEREGWWWFNGRAPPEAWGSGRKRKTSAIWLVREAELYSAVGAAHLLVIKAEHPRFHVEP